MKRLLEAYLGSPAPVREITVRINLLDPVEMPDGRRGHITDTQYNPDGSLWVLVDTNEDFNEWIDIRQVRRL